MYYSRWQMRKTELALTYATAARRRRVYDIVVIGDSRGSGFPRPREKEAPSDVIWNRLRRQVPAIDGRLLSRLHGAMNRSWLQGVGATRVEKRG